MICVGSVFSSPLQVTTGVTHTPTSDAAADVAGADVGVDVVGAEVGGAAVVDVAPWPIPCCEFGGAELVDDTEPQPAIPRIAPAATSAANLVMCPPRVTFSIGSRPLRGNSGKAPSARREARYVRWPH